MSNKTNKYFHGFRRIFYDILRDTNSKKYSMTKFAALFGLIALMATITMSLIIMWNKKEIDHILLIQVIGFVLTVLGFKNNFGINLTKDSKIITQDTKFNSLQKSSEEDENDTTNDAKG